MTTIGVHIGESARRIGTLFHEARGARERASFEYVDAWREDPGAFEIGPDLPLVAGPQFHQRVNNGSVFPGAIADTEPDGWGKRIIARDHAKRRDEARRLGEEFDSRPLDSLDYLLAVDDVSRVGALRFETDGVFRRAPEGGRTTPPLIELAQVLSATRAVEANEETLADLAYLRGRGTSLGGLRPKCSVLDDDGHLAIGKFPSIQDERPVTRGEVLALRLAAEAGVDAAEARIVDSDGAAVALVRRFDRDSRGKRIGYISAATMLGVDPRGPEDHSYTEIVDAIRVHGLAVQADIDELWRRIAFSILISNFDDHLMNHAFLQAANGRWRLSPAFDINPFPDRARELKTWISEDTGPEARIDSLMSVTPYFRINSARAKEILNTIEAALARWRDVGRLLELNDRELEQFAPAFEHREREVVRRLLA